MGGELRAWLDNDWLCWGVGPVLASSIGYFVTALLLELVIRTCPVKLFHFDSESRDRYESMGKTQATVANLWAQIWKAAIVILGPNALVGGAIGAVIFPSVVGSGRDFPDWPELTSAVASLVALLVVGDFGLYVGHRVQHESEFLWRNFHSLHHKLSTPSPIGTLYIHEVDATLQGSLPMLLAGLVVRPHPLVFCLYVCIRLAENVINHSGIDSRLFDALTFKVLPFRASVAHHDAHHWFCNRSRNAKNYGEGLWIWDWVFGTLTDSEKRKQGAKLE